MGEWMSWGKASWGVFSTCLQCCYKLNFFTCILLSVTVIIKKQTNKKTKNKVNFLRLGIFFKEKCSCLPNNMANFYIFFSSPRLAQSSRKLCWTNISKIMKEATFVCFV